jgi:hypothetical protein
MPTAKVRAATILGEFEQARAELVGKAVVPTRKGRYGGEQLA